jgi:hypothetical protein
VVNVWLSWATYLDFSSIRDSSARDDPALPARCPRLPNAFSTEVVDLRVNYFRHARWFFGSLLAVLLVSLVKNVVMSGSLQGPFDLAFHLFWIAGATIAAATRSDLFHKAFVCVAGVSFIVYIGALFAELH